MSISKTAIRTNNYRQPLFYFNSAREALQEVLHQLKEDESYTLLLPNYIGFSSNEGSGIYDPVAAEGIEHIFYPLDRRLHIKLDAFSAALGNTEHPVVLLVHYFGYPDPSAAQIAELCKLYGAPIIEDAAHALYTDFVDQKCGRYGNFVIYSLHKMLPVQAGGMLKFNSGRRAIDSKAPYAKYAPFDYNLHKIAARRKDNAAKWQALISAFPEHFEILRSHIDEITPQTFPILLKTYDRDEMCFRLNDAGFGAVSLYHTLIEPLRDKEADAFWVSERIMNLPVHQDTNADEIEEMFEKMLGIVHAGSGAAKEA